MAVAINGSGTITGVSVGGLPDGIVDTDMLAANAVTAAKATGGRSLLEADQWRINSGATSASQNFLSNWERNDTNFDKVGTGMTESSGYFSFPSTGIWFIEFSATCWYSDYARRYAYAAMQVTVNNSSYDRRTEGYANFTDLSSDAHYLTCNCSYIFDVTSTTNCKLYFQGLADGAVNWMGTTNSNQTYATFIRLGDT